MIAMMGEMIAMMFPIPYIPLDSRLRENDVWASPWPPYALRRGEVPRCARNDMV